MTPLLLLMTMDYQQRIRGCRWIAVMQINAETDWEF
jgi:hypothetical protein|tara:strand:- start:57 stop:164 length:108 start_codon:yes stop_codon:yes gene_type:complete